MPPPASFSESLCGFIDHSVLPPSDNLNKATRSSPSQRVSRLGLLCPPRPMPLNTTPSILFSAEDLSLRTQGYQSNPRFEPTCWHFEQKGALVSPSLPPPPPPGNPDLPRWFIPSPRLRGVNTPRDTRSDGLVGGNGGHSSCHVVLTMRTSPR